MFLSEFVYPGWWDFDNGVTSKIDDVLTEHGGLPHHVLPLAAQLNFFGQTSRGGHSEAFLLIEFLLWDPTPPSFLKVISWPMRF